jgi:hypothetical protein
VTPTNLSGAGATTQRHGQIPPPSAGQDSTGVLLLPEASSLTPAATPSLGLSLNPLGLPHMLSLL